MSKISLSPDVAGTGIFTIASPGTNTNRTLTLPDDTGTIVTNSGNQAGSFTTLNTSGQVVFNDAGADVDFRVEGDTDANLLFVDAGNDRVGVKTSSPAVAFDVVGQVRASTGILFGSDTAAANALDDYEEGTFTATLKGSSADPSTPVTSTARYTKIGDMVSLFIGYDNVNTTGASGSISVIGLPFTNNGVRTVGSINSYSLATFSGGYLSCDLESTGTTIFALHVQSASTWGLATHNAGAGRYMFIAISYTV